MSVNGANKDLSYEDYLGIELKKNIIKDNLGIKSINHDNNHSLITFLISIGFNKRDAYYYSCGISKNKSIYYNNEKVYIEYDEGIIISFTKDQVGKWILNVDDLTTKSMLIAMVKKYVCLDVDKLLKAAEGF